MHVCRLMSFNIVVETDFQFFDCETTVFFAAVGTFHLALKRFSIASLVAFLIDTNPWVLHKQGHHHQEDQSHQSP